MTTPFARLTALVQQWKGRGFSSIRWSTHDAYVVCATELEALLLDLALQGDAGSPQTKAEEEDIPSRVGPLVPCVAPTGTTAEQPTGAVTAAGTLYERMQAFIEDLNRAKEEAADRDVRSVLSMVIWQLQYILNEPKYQPGDAGSHAQQEWKCKARPSTDPPQDCDWPQCGCDPYADKVLAAVSEAGFVIIPETEVATLQQERKLLLDAVNFEDRPDSLHTLGLDFLSRGELLEKTLAYVVALREQLAALQAQSGCRICGKPICVGWSFPVGPFCVEHWAAIKASVERLQVDAKEQAQIAQQEPKR